MEDGKKGEGKEAETSSDEFIVIDDEQAAKTTTESEAKDVAQEKKEDKTTEAATTTQEEEEDKKAAAAAPSTEDSEVKDATAEEQTSASLKDEIRVVNDLSLEPPVRIEAPDDEPHPVQKAWSEFATNTKVKVDKVVKDVQGALDEHVVPRVENVKTNTTQKLAEMRTSTKGAFDEHVVPRFENVKANTTKSLSELGQNTKGAIDTHVLPHVESFKSNTGKALISTRTAYEEKMEPHVSSTINKAKTYAPYYMGTAPALFATNEAPKWYMNILEGTSRAFGQVIFCNNPVTGGFVLLAMLLASPLSAICATLCVVTVNLTAFYLEMDTLLMQKGLLAYNAVLVGSGIATFMTFDNAGWFISMIVSILAAPLVLLAYVYTATLVSWPLHLPANGVLIVLLLSAVLWDATTVTVEETSQGGFHFLGALFNGLSQILFVKNAFSGFLIAVGMILFSRILAASALLGSLTALLMSVFMDMSILDVKDGMVGFNAALTSIALLYFVMPSIKSIPLAIFGVFLTLVMYSALASLLTMLSIPITTMTLPFCLATLPCLMALDSETMCGTMQLVSDLVPPEQHLAKPLSEDDEQPNVEVTDEPPHEETPLISV